MNTILLPGFCSHRADMHGTSIFAQNDHGEIFHTYSTYFRGDELIVGAFMWLDLAPKGRNETDGVMSWGRLHDTYPNGQEVKA